MNIKLQLDEKLMEKVLDIGKDTPAFIELIQKLSTAIKIDPEDIETIEMLKRVVTYKLMLSGRIDNVLKCLSEDKDD